MWVSCSFIFIKRNLTQFLCEESRFRGINFVMISFRKIVLIALQINTYRGNLEYEHNSMTTIRVNKNIYLFAHYFG